MSPLSIDRCCTAVFVNRRIEKVDKVKLVDGRSPKDLYSLEKNSVIGLASSINTTRLILHLPPTQIQATLISRQAEK